jgi:ActR/RegA family two-component response regulator
MKNILFLDDDLKRTEEFLNNFSNSNNVITTVENAEECINKLKDFKFDFISLDHDLGGEIFVDSSRKDTGMEVVRFLNSNKTNQGLIIVHSYNPVASAGMFIELNSNGYEAFQIKFGSSEYFDKVSKILDGKIIGYKSNKTYFKKSTFSDKLKKYIKFIVKG